MFIKQLNTLIFQNIASFNRSHTKNKSKTWKMEFKKIHKYLAFKVSAKDQMNENQRDAELAA